MKLSDFKDIPLREYMETPSTYNSFYVVPLKRKHDSGFKLLQIVGCKTASTPTETVNVTDVLEFESIKDLVRIRMHVYPSGVILYWSNTHAFKFMSNEIIKIIKKPN